MKMTHEEKDRALFDPWSWTLKEIRRHNWSSAYLAEQTGLSRSTVRALFNKTNGTPRYAQLLPLLRFAVDNYGDGVVSSLPPNTRMPVIDVEAHY
jgi:transcriptional regulator with XRE-family HTH domain